MLLIRGLGRERHRTRLELFDECEQTSALLLFVACILFAQPLRQQPPDADANQPIRQQITFQQLVQVPGRLGGGDRGKARFVSGAHNNLTQLAAFRNHGTNALVFC